MKERKKEKLKAMQLQCKAIKRNLWEKEVCGTYYNGEVPLFYKLHIWKVFEIELCVPGSPSDHIDYNVRN